MTTLEQQVQEVSAAVDNLIQSMVEHDASEFQINFTDKVLRPALIGLTAGHAIQVPTEDVENAIVETFSSIIMELLKRTHRNRIKSRANADEAAIHAESLIRRMVTQVQTMVEDDFGPKVQLVKPNGSALN